MALALHTAGDPPTQGVYKWTHKEEALIAAHFYCVIQVCLFCHPSFIMHLEIIYLIASQAVSGSSSSESRQNNSSSSVGLLVLSIFTMYCVKLCVFRLEIHEV